MGGFRNNSFLISGSKLLPWRENHYNFKLCRKNHQIIKGTIYNQDQTPCAGATVLVTQIDNEKQERMLLGFVVTDKAGHYLFSLEANPKMKYELTVYAPIIHN
jgi:uncharacterized protein YegP (UPF0339 family)